MEPPNEHCPYPKNSKHQSSNAMIQLRNQYLLMLPPKNSESVPSLQLVSLISSSQPKQHLERDLSCSESCSHRARTLRDNNGNERRPDSSHYSCSPHHYSPKWTLSSCALSPLTQEMLIINKFSCPILSFTRHPVLLSIPSHFLDL